MRLTLRTLLAYMDDMLDPADQEELGRKIEASPFATELIHRSRDAVRRLRLSAPEVLAGDSGDLHGGDHNLDANTAAEYLDSMLSPDDVAEFERNCLEAGPQRRHAAGRGGVVPPHPHARAGRAGRGRRRSAAADVRTRQAKPAAAAARGTRAAPYAAARTGRTARRPAAVAPSSLTARPRVGRRPAGRPDEASYRITFSKRREPSPPRNRWLP